MAYDKRLEKTENKPTPIIETIRRVDFDKDLSFQKELYRRVDEHLKNACMRKRDCWQMYVKTAFMVVTFIACYVLLVFFASTFWQALPLAVLLGLSIAGIGFNIQHDGGHNAYSDHTWINRIMAWTLDVIGASSMRWHWKHTIIHHTFVNITGFDTDIDVGGIARVSPHKKLRWFHRWQHLYMWPLYGLLAIKMQLLDDFRYVVTGRLGPHRIPRPTNWNLAAFLLGKTVFIGMAFVIPLKLHPLFIVLFYYTAMALTLGIVMSLVFITPHLVDKADFPLPNRETGRMATPWAVHQAMVTVDFARENKILTALLGGLNHHKEHHLFPTICHINYPAITKVVEQTCRDFGLPYHEHKTFLSGIAAHYRWLRAMEKPDRE